MTNDLLSDHADGVLCQVGPDRVLDVLQQNGFTLQNQSNDGGKAVWTVVQGESSGGDSDKPNDQNPRSAEDNEGDGDAEDQGGDDEGEGGGDEGDE